MAQERNNNQDKRLTDMSRITQIEICDFPRTRHFPWESRSTRDDLIASESDISFALQICDSIEAEEKVDGANLGVAFDLDDQPIARNRNHFLKKSFQAKTPAKMQFSSLWTWMYERRECFSRLESVFGEKVVIYGEWLFAQHSVRYDSLPDRFLAYDIWLPSDRSFVATPLARAALTESGFSVVNSLLSLTKRVTVQELKAIALYLRDGASAYSSLDQREGAYFKFSKLNRLVDRYKIVSQSFRPGARWDSKTLTKNKLRSCPVV